MRVVALGGGHGLAVTLTALRLAGEEPTAIVAVADDGGFLGGSAATWACSRPATCARRCSPWPTPPPRSASCSATA